MDTAMAVDMDTAMAVDMERRNTDAGIYWDNCPVEILLMIFKGLTASTLSACMFVNSKWRRLVEDVLQRFNMWQEIAKVVVCEPDEIKLKCEESLNWQQIYYNHVIWHNMDNAQIDLLHKREINTSHVKKMFTYRNNFIVVSDSGITYYDVDNLNIIKTIEISCLDFIENDYTIFVAHKDNKFMEINMFKKATPTDFNMRRDNDLVTENILVYKLVKNKCYLLDHRHNLFVYTIRYPNIIQQFLARHYGNPSEAAHLYVYKGDVFLALTHGAIYSAHTGLRSFEKISDSPVPHPVKKSVTISSEHCLQFGLLFMVDSKDTFQSERILTESALQISDVSCVAQHRDMLILGYRDGSVLFVTTRNLSKPKALRRQFNLKDKETDVDSTIISIDVYEHDGYFHLFAAMKTAIYQLLITYPHCNKNMWKDYPQMQTILTDIKVTKQSREK